MRGCCRAQCGFTAHRLNTVFRRAAPRSYGTGKFPLSVAIGDLNGDRKPDVVTANLNGDAISVLFNKGDGKLQGKRDYRAGSEPASVAIGDLNGDGHADVVGVNYSSNTVSVWLNRGDGGLQARRDYRTGGHASVTSGPSSVAIGDLNGDGQPDVVSANNGANTVSVLLNRGDGSFQRKVDYPTASTPIFVAIGDLNDDGDPDLVSANVGAGTVSVLLNRGDGSFQPKVDYKTGIEPDSVAIGDLNLDGKPDLAVANTAGDYGPSRQPAGTISVLLGRGDGNLRPQVTYQTGSVSPRSVTIVDLNRDGASDLAVANTPEPDAPGGGTISLLLNRGHGAFQLALFYPADARPSGGGLGDKGLAVGDLSADGKADLATVDVIANRIYVLIGTSAPTCTVPLVRGTSLATATRAIVGSRCRVGKSGHAYSNNASKGQIISQDPRARTVLPRGGKVDLVVSLGAR